MGNGRLRVVLGGRRYEVEAPWGLVPAGFQFGLVSQLAVDSHGYVHVAQRGDPAILLFEPSGRLVHIYGQEILVDPHGIARDAADRILVVDRDAHQILLFDRHGHEQGRLGERHSPAWGEPFNHPTDVAVAADGGIWVADGYGNSRVHRFDPDGRLISSFGEPGKGPGQFTTPHAIWVDRQGRVLVADRENDRVQVFDQEGRHLASWGDLFHPMDIWEDGDGNILVTDQIPRLSLFDPHGSLIGRCRPVLNGAHGVWGAPDGSIFLAEMIPSRVTRLVPLD
jgi:DNA-binding beta-propeller fold protein YncE